MYRSIDIQDLTLQEPSLFPLLSKGRVHQEMSGAHEGLQVHGQRCTLVSRQRQPSPTGTELCSKTTCRKRVETGSRKAWHSRHDLMSASNRLDDLMSVSNRSRHPLLFASFSMILLSHQQLSPLPIL